MPTEPQNRKPTGIVNGSWPDSSKPSARASRRKHDLNCTISFAAAAGSCLSDHVFPHLPVPMDPLGGLEKGWKFSGMVSAELPSDSQLPWIALPHTQGQNHL